MTDSDIINDICECYGVSLHDFDARNATRGQNSTRLPVKARRAACKAFYAKGYTKARIARLVGFTGASSVRYSMNGS